MFAFIEVLKAFAAILITNSHYGSIWPIPAMATGGLLGDVMFFAASGFCLANIKQSFPKWYAKRIFRIYPVLWMINILGVIIGLHKIAGLKDIIALFIYPTFYHFIESIMILYILFYVLMWVCKKTNINAIWMVLFVSAVWLVVYIFAFDKSYYHIDVVEEHMVRFLFLISMLFGAWFRNNCKSKFSNLKPVSITIYVFMVFVTTTLYFGSKLFFQHYEEFANFQILNQVALILLLISIMNLLCAWENRRKKELNESVLGKLILFISSLTLEIYLTQYLVYWVVPQMKFPLNFLVVTVFIIVASFVAHFIGNYLTKKLDLLLVRKKNNK